MYPYIKIKLLNLEESPVLAIRSRPLVVPVKYFYGSRGFIDEDTER